jgi:hypothetical protein
MRKESAHRRRSMSLLRAGRRRLIRRMRADGATTSRGGDGGAGSSACGRAGRRRRLQSVRVGRGDGLRRRLGLARVCLESIGWEGEEMMRTKN